MPVPRTPEERLQAQQLTIGKWYYIEGEDHYLIFKTAACEGSSVAVLGIAPWVRSSWPLAMEANVNMFMLTKRALWDGSGTVYLFQVIVGEVIGWMKVPKDRHFIAANTEDP